MFLNNNDFESPICYWVVIFNVVNSDLKGVGYIETYLKIFV